MPFNCFDFSHFISEVWLFSKPFTFLEEVTCLGVFVWCFVLYLLQFLHNQPLGLSSRLIHIFCFLSARFIGFKMYNDHVPYYVSNIWYVSILNFCKSCLRVVWSSYFKSALKGVS